MVVTYLGTVLTTRTGAHGEESAFLQDGATLRCFLGGLTEAKRFVRERKQGPAYGPKCASYTITLDDSGSVSSYGRRESALRDVEYFVAQGRLPTLTRTEFCAYPGCDGHGEISTRMRSGRYSSRPCPCHDEPTHTIESTTTATSGVK